MVNSRLSKINCSLAIIKTWGVVQLKRLKNLTQVLPDRIPIAKLNVPISAAKIA
jgi:hypothetical protein